MDPERGSFALGCGTLACGRLLLGPAENARHLAGREYVPQPDPASYTLDAEGYVDVTAAAGLPANSSFNITLWANDGTTQQTESVPVTIKSSCKRHY